MLVWLLPRAACLAFRASGVGQRQSSFVPHLLARAAQEHGAGHCRPVCQKATTPKAEADAEAQAANAAAANSAAANSAAANAAAA